jgi:hypothetical protein
MSEAYLIAISFGKLSPLSDISHVEQVRPILQSLFQKSGVPARRVQEIHWHGGDDEFWFNGLGRLAGLPPEVAGFHWPATALLAHTQLQNMARTIEAGGRDLVILAQETSGQVVTMLLASPSAVGIYNLSPRACLGHKLAVSSAPDGLLKTAFLALKKADEVAARVRAEQDAAELSVEETSTPPAGQAPIIMQPSNYPDKKSEPEAAGKVQWIAGARRPDPDALKAAFPGASWLDSGQAVPPGDLFLLSALVGRLEEKQDKRGLLVSVGSQRSGLVTLVERV